MTREEWLEERKTGIGGSDASAIVGLNPYSDNIKLWEIKTKRAEQEDISDKPYVKYGVAMGNSVPELLEIAPYQTARVDEDGIEKGLKKFGLI